MNIAELARHHPRRHAAVRTTDYIFHQLIPYLGNKRKLLPLIGQAIEQTDLSRGSFVDLFAGSTVVARFAKSLGFRVLANDWEPYAYEIVQGTIVCNRQPTFRKIGGVKEAFTQLAAEKPITGYVTRHLCPKSDERPDPDRERMFFTRRNGRRIDAMRERIARWESEKRISPIERSYLLSAFLYAASYVSNTSGVFKGFHRGWGGKTGTALYRILSDIELNPPVLHDNGQLNLAVRDDAHVLAPELTNLLGESPDIVYLDPPYNQHPYGSNYHVLNTIALWDHPPVSDALRPNGRLLEKSAIRKDWRSLRRSPYNAAAEALPALKSLVGSIDARWIMLSYSTDGNIPFADVLRILGDRGRLTVLAKPYKRYRVSTPRMSPRSHNVEFVALVHTVSRSSRRQTERLTQQVADRLVRQG